MKALRVQVERVVRPIRASSQRKDRMREELLAHLTQVFEAELAKTGDAESATSEALRRFGDAGELVGELQSSVPWIERWAFFSFPHSGPLRRRTGESPGRYILRSHAWAIAFAIAGYVLIALVATVAASQRPHRVDRPGVSQLLILLMGTAAIQSATVISDALLCERIRQELEGRVTAATAIERRRATWRVVAYTATCSAVLGAAFAGLMLLIGICVPIPFITRAWFWSILGAAVALGPPFVLWQSWSWQASTRRFENWESLDLDEPPSA